MGLRAVSFKACLHRPDTAPMTLLHQAMRAGHAPHRSAPPRRDVLVAGGAGALGAAVLEQLLACRAFGHVVVLVSQPLNTALRGLRTLPESALEPAPGGDAGPPEDTAVVVFDRERHANGREQAFVRPEPDRLVALAHALHERGVKRLVVVLPHAPSMLPDALKRGLANLDEQALASLGFEHLVFIRSAQARNPQRARRHLQRLADWVLAQLQLMIPQRERPVRAQKVAQLTAAIAAQLHAAPSGTRVLPPELVWLASQATDVESLARDWLHGRALPELAPAASRM